MRRSLVVLVFPLVLPLRARAQAKGHCTGGAPDSAWMASAPVYRDCEVDKKARQRGSDPKLALSLLQTPAAPNGCMRVELEFVVDTAGRPELATVRKRSSNSSALEQLVLDMLPQLQFVAARRSDEPVRQLVVYKRAVPFLRTRTVTRAGELPATPPQPPRPGPC